MCYIFQMTSSLSRVRLLRDERTQYPEEIHEKNGFSQVSKNFRIYLNNISR